jgi:hypothetical protein
LVSCGPRAAWSMTTKRGSSKAAWLTFMLAYNPHRTTALSTFSFSDNA